MKRLGFLGAMNRDLVAAIPGATLLPLLAPRAAPLLETAISDAVAEEGARLLLARGAADHLGGSAFNAARAAALLNGLDSRLDLAFFGIAGTLDGASPHLEALRHWSVDIAGIWQSPLPPATCLAMVEAGGRTLLTASGANAGIIAVLRDEEERLAAQMAGCDLLHVTSYLDPEAPGRVAALLARARRLNPRLLVSLDPGAAWVMPGGGDFDKLLAQTDILQLNSEEFAHLGGPEAVPALAVRRLVVTRSHVGAVVYEGRADGAILRHVLPETPLPPHVEDATGAGDTFCGAFLWHFLARPDAPLEAARRGFALARAKVAISGPVTAAMVQALENRLAH